LLTTTLAKHSPRQPIASKECVNCLIYINEKDIIYFLNENCFIVLLSSTGYQV